MNVNTLDWINAFADGTLECKTAEGKRVFEVRTQVIEDSGGRVFHYFVKPVTPPDTSGEVYFAAFHEVEEGLLQVDVLNNPLPEPYQRCGITRALFALVAQERKSTIRSSEKCARDEERRSEDATRVWERMVRDQLARYNPTEDRFYYEPARQ